MSRVLVTGASGFIGQPVCRQLREAGWTVIATGRRQKSPSGLDGVEWMAADLLDPAELSRITAAARATHLLHLAWVTEHGAYWESPENHAWLAASQQLLRAFAAQGGRRAVVAGTCAEYDWNVPNPAAAPLHPATLYGRSKLALHDWATSFAAESGLSLAWGRVFFAFGPGEDPRRLVPYVARQLLRGEPVLCGSGQGVRDFLHVDDLGLLFASLLKSDATGDFDLGTGHGLSIRTLVETLARVAGRPDLPRFGARADPPNEPARLVARHLVPDIAIDGDSNAHLEQALARTLDWWRQAGFSAQ